MKRKDFIRNTLMALAATMLPKPLLPSAFDEDDKDYPFQAMPKKKMYLSGFDPCRQGNRPMTFIISFYNGELVTDEEYVAEYLNQSPNCL